MYDDLRANPGSYTAAETERINRSYRLLDEMDSSTTRNHNLFVNQKIELFDNQNDPYELNNLADDAAQAGTRHQLLKALYKSTINTNDTYVDARLIPATDVTGDHFEGRATGSNFGDDAMWTTPILGNSGADFSFNADGTIDAAAGSRVLATFEGETPGVDESFVIAIDVNFAGAGVGAGMVFGFQDSSNFLEFQLLDGNSAVGGANKDVRLVQMIDGVATTLFQVNDLENIDRNESYRLVVDFDAVDSMAELLILNKNGVPYFESQYAFGESLASGSQFGVSAWSSTNAQFDRFDLMITAAVPEPSSLVMLSVACITFMSRRHLRSQLPR